MHTFLLWKKLVEVLLQTVNIWKYVTIFYIIKCFITRALSQNMTNAPEGDLTPNLKNVEVTVQIKLHYCRKLSRQISSMKKKKEQ